MPADQSAALRQRREQAEQILAARLRRHSQTPARADLRPPADDAGHHPLSAAQRRMWFMHQMNPRSTAYTVATAARLHGELDLRALAEALNFLMRRHEMLRSSFTAADGRPWRDVDDDCQVILHAEDVRGLRHAEREAVISRRLAEETHRPFGLSRAPLFRVSVWRADDAEHVLAITLHHMISDGWSLGVLKRELAAAYQAACAGRPPDLPPIPQTFDDVIAEEDAWADGPAGQADLRYWTNKLAAAPVTELPMARPRSPAAGFAGHSAEAELDPALVRQLEGLALRNDASLYMVLATAFAALLHKYSGQPEVVFGSPVANRTTPAVQHMLGLFVNSVVLRIDMSGRGNFCDLLDRVRATSLEALSHQRLPFERIVEQIGPDRALSHNPLFQVMFALQNADTSDLALPGIRAVPLRLATDTARFDLECTVLQRPGRLTVRMTSNADTMDAATTSRLVGHFRGLLAAIADDPGCALGDLPLLSDEEQAWSRRAERAAAVAGPPACLHEMFQAQAGRTPDAIALEAGGQTLTFAGLDARATKLAAWLREQGTGVGDIVAVCAERTADLVVAILGVLKAGAAFLPLDPADPPRRRAFMVRDANAKMIIADGATASRLAGAPVPVVDLAGAAGREGGATRGAVAPTDLAYVIYTSGTTGRPKAVAVEHRNVVNTLRGCQAYFGFGPADRGLVLASCTFDVFYYELFSALLAGGHSVLVPRDDLFDTGRICALLADATCLQAVSGLMEHLLTSLRSEGVDRCDRMRVVVTGGDLVPPRLLGELSEMFPAARVSVTYGPTEAAIFCTAYTMPRGEQPAGHPIGCPLPGTVVRVADDSGAPLPPGVDGEILIGGAGVARGYLARPGQTAERFVDIGAERFYRSGDRGRRAADGSIEYLGRADRQVKVRGFRIELGEVEAVLAAAPGVSQAAVVPQGRGPSARRLAAYIVPTDAALRGMAGHGESKVKVGHWREVFDTSYGGRVRVLAGDYDFTGWNSSYTGEPIPLAQMREWLEGTIAQILDRADPDLVARRALRVLDIGCGTGLVLLALAKHCARYVGTDFSGRALDELRQVVARRGLDQVELYQADAAEPPDGGDGFDVVVINSVVQYLPDEAYLLRVLRTALARTRPGGFVFVGDVRSLALVSQFHACVQMAASPDAAAAEVLDQARGRARDEAELLVHPAFFAGLADGRIVSRVETEPRRGQHGNELTRYRFDAVLHRAADPANAAAPANSATQWHDWGAEDWTGERLRRLLASQRPETVAFLRIPNVLLLPDHQAYGRLLAAAGRQQAAMPVGRLLAAAGSQPPPMPAGRPLGPDELRSLASLAGYGVALSCLRGMTDGTFDAVLWQAGRPPPELRWPGPEDRPGRLGVSEPLREAGRRRLRAQVLDFLVARLPEYMQPSSLTVLGELPLTPNGKVDRDALPTSQVSSAPGTRQPQTPAERLVAGAMEAVLGRGDIMATDDFFAIGGTSLLAVQLAVLVRARGTHLTPRQVFELRTVERIAEPPAAGRGDDRGHPAQTAFRDAQAAARQAAPRVSSCLPAPSDPWTSARDILLTGATGMLGIHLLEALLERTSARLTCLVRAADDDAARRRLADQFRWYFPGATAATLDDRVRVLAGDLTRPQLGVATETWDALRECDQIVHAAADTRHLADTDDIFSVNLGGTRRLLDLAATAPASRLHHVSTIGIAGVLPDGAPAVTLTEDRLDVGQRPTEDYSASKLAAEHAVRQFASDGHRADVYRVGTIGPHSVTGRFQRNIDEHFLSRYLHATIELGLACDWPGRRFALIPADVLARALLALGSADNPAGHAFHLQTPHTLTHGEIAARLNAFGYRVRLVRPDQFSGLLDEYGRDPRKVTAVGRLLPTVDREPGRRVRLDATRTTALLGELGITYPPPTTAWLERFIRHGISVGYFPPPAEEPADPRSGRQAS